MDPLDEFEQCWSGLGLVLVSTHNCIGLRLGGLDYNTTSDYTFCIHAPFLFNLNSPVSVLDYKSNACVPAIKSL